MKSSKGTIRKTFWKLGCSGALFSTLNYEFGHSQKHEERATGPLCGGFMQTGHQCGQLWGASLAVGAESSRKMSDKDQAIASAITATQLLLKSFSERTKSHNCKEVTGCNPSNPAGLIKYFITGKPIYCMNIGVKWAPEAYTVVSKNLSPEKTKGHENCASCATEVLRKMGASDEEMVMVSGFAGGLGLSGNACGALAAAVWMKTLVKSKKGDSLMSIPEAKETLKAFYAETNNEILCHKISGKRFKTTEEHTDFINKGGCARLIEVLAQ